MSRQIALDTLHLRPTPRIAHTEYSLEMNSDLVRKLTGMDPNNPEAQTAVRRAFYDACAIDMLWYTNDGPVDWGQAGRVTDMGHAEYAEHGTDKRAARACPFESVEEVYEFDPHKEYGLPGSDELTRYYEDCYRTTQANYPGQLITGGYYKTVVSGAIQTFGWDMLLTAAADRERFATVLQRFGRYTRHYARAWARTSIPAYIQHDDMVWTQGPFMHPNFYRAVIFPLYRDLWIELKKAGKKILFCSDGTFDMFMPDIAAVGADGFIFEPSNNLDYVVAAFGRTHVIVSSKVDCRTMTLRPWEDVQGEMDATFRLAKAYPGFMWAVGNHIPPNVPTAISERYLAYFKAHAAR
jgi:hypothetical protein